MKRIIDIPEKIEEYIKDYIPIGAGDNVFCYPDEIVRMIQNGIPLEQIKAEIDRQEKWLSQAGYTAYNVDIAFDSIKSVLAGSEEKE